MTLYLPVGPPGCGKSALAVSMVGERLIPQDAVVSTDRLREWMTGSVTDQSANGPAWEIARTITHERLDRGLSVYFDATNLNPDWYDKMLAKAKEGEHRVLFIMFDTPYALCRSRNMMRGSSAIPDVAVDRMIRLHKDIDLGNLQSNGSVITGEENRILLAGIKAWLKEG